MRQLQFIVIAFVTVLFVTNAVLWRKAIAVLLCGVLSFNSVSCYGFLSDSGKAIAAQPSTPPFTSSAKQLDADHAEIRLIFPDNCEFISHLTKTSEGIVQDSLEYRHNNLEACSVKPFTAHYSNEGKTVEVQIKGQNDRLRLDASARPGSIEQTYQDPSGKVQQQVTPIPIEILDYLKKSQKKPLVKGESSVLPNLRDSQHKQTIQEPWLIASINADRLTRPDSATISLDLSACGIAKFGESVCDSIETVTSFPGVMEVATYFIPALGLASLASGIVCWGLYGGFPPIFGIWKTALVQKAINLSDAYSRNARRLGKNFPANQRLLNDLEKLLSETLPKVEGLDQLKEIIEKFAEQLLDTDLKDVTNTKLHAFANSKECNPKKPSGTLIQAKSHGDPHLVTFDGLKYDLQTLGETILIKSNDGNFEVQARQEPFSPSLSVNSAVAMQVGQNRVALYAREFPDADTSTPLRVNGKATAIQGDKLTLKGGGEILKQGNTYVISSAGGEKVLLSLSGAGNTAFFNVSTFVYKQPETYRGLLGNVNGNPKDDLQMRDGKNVLEARSTYGDVKQVVNLVGLRLPGVLDRAEQVYFDQLYKEFANSWRVKQEESLFDYPPGRTTQSYINPGFPDKYLTLNMLSADQIQKAQTACTEAKVTEDLMEGCIFDVGFSGLSDFARTTSEISGYINTVNQLFPGLNIPTPNQFAGPSMKERPKVCVFGVCL